MLAAERMMMVARIPPPTGTALADTMTRADDDFNINPCSDSGSWTVDGGTWGITSNLGFCQTNTGGTQIDGMALIRRDFGSYAVDVTIKNRRNATGGTTAMWVAYDPATQSGYRFTFTSSTSADVQRFESGAAVDSSAITLTAWTSGGGTTVATLRFVHDGFGNFDIYQNGTLKGSWTDTGTVLTGTWVCLSSNRQNTDYWSDFAAVNI